MSNLLEMFGLDAGVFGAVAETPEVFERTSTSAMLQVGKKVPYSASINGVKVPAYVTLKSARLTRLSMLEQKSAATGNDYNLVTGIFKPVDLDIEVLVDGETINLVDLMHKFAVAASGKDMTRDEFVLAARNIGLNLTGGMPLFWQQFGASADGFRAAVAAFRDAGAQDVISNMKNRGRIVAAYQHPGDGVEVTAFELGSVDRTKSSRHAFDGIGQGFLNLVDAQIEQFTRIVTLRKSAATLRSEMNANTGTWTQEQIRKANGLIENYEKMSKQWQSNWAGAQQRIVALDSGGFEKQNIYDPVNAPCGRFTMNGLEVDLWTNSARANTSNVSVANVDADEPF